MSVEIALRRAGDRAKLCGHGLRRLLPVPRRDPGGRRRRRHGDHPARRLDPRRDGDRGRRPPPPGDGLHRPAPLPPLSPGAARTFGARPQLDRQRHGAAARTRDGPRHRGGRDRVGAVHGPRRRKDEADAAATEAMRRTMDEIDFAGRDRHRRGRARRGADALHRRAGRPTGADARRRPASRHRRRPARGHEPRRPRPGRRDHGPRRVRGGRPDPRPRHLHGEAVRRPGRGRQGRHPRAPTENLGASPRRSAGRSATSPSSSSSGRATTTLIAEVRAGRRPDQAHRRRRPVGGDLVRRVGHRRPRRHGHRRRAGGRDHGGRAALPRRRDPGRFRYRSDEERERGARMGHGDEDRVYLDRGPGAGREPRLRRDRRHARRPARGRPLLRRRRADPLAGDGLPDQAGPLRRHGPHVRPRQPAARPALGSSPMAPPTRLQGLGRAVPAAAAARPRRRRGAGRLRVGLDQRPLPAVAPYRRPRPERPRLAGRRGRRRPSA